MYRFIVITLALIILYLMFKNSKVFSELLKIISDQFNLTFKAVTSAENF